MDFVSPRGETCSLDIVERSGLGGILDLCAQASRSGMVRSAYCEGLPRQAARAMRRLVSFFSVCGRKYAGIEQSSRRKIDRLEAAANLQNLAALPGNRFEVLKGDRQGQYSIRINDQWRVCFEWSKGSPDTRM